MLQLGDYDIYIFDCDGVILNSNQLKIEAMKNTLEAYFVDEILIEKCLSYFSNNFGKSRFHHVAYFLEKIFMIEAKEKCEIERLILKGFSERCRTLYISATLTPNFTSFIDQCDGKRFVASGSEQEELRYVFHQRKLDKLFDGIFGSPVSKDDNIQRIIEQEGNSNAVMFGDAESDMFAALKNGIDFVFYMPFSNVKDKMIDKCKLYNIPIIDDFSSVKF